MTFWTNQRLHSALGDGGVVTPFDPANIKQAAYELGVAREYAVTSEDGDGQRIEASGGDFIKIPAGQFALLLTEERVAIPADALGFISVKAGWKLKGLVNVSGFHVDPGFSGRLKFSVYNASGQTLNINPSRRVFVLWLSSLVEALPNESLYRGAHQDQDRISDDDLAAIAGMVASPAGLSNRISALGDRLTGELPRLEAALTKTITETNHSLALKLEAKSNELALQLSNRSSELAVQLARVGTQQKLQWVLLVGLVGVLISVSLRGCLETGCNTEGNTHRTPPNSLSRDDAGMMDLPARPPVEENRPTGLPAHDAAP